MVRSTYTSPEAWAIFAGGLIIGVVLTSFFWAYITIPKDVKDLKKAAGQQPQQIELSKPAEFISFCEDLDGKAEWDSGGYRSCSIDSTEGKDVVVMNVFCKKFELNLSYGSYGVRCEGNAAK